MKWLAVLLGSLGVLAVLLVVSLAAGWIGGTAETVSFEHSKEQTTAVLQDEQGMIAAAGNVCDVKDSSHQSTDPTLTEDPTVAYRATYRNIKADYDRRMANFFEAANTKKLPIPDALHGLPKVAPTLKERLATVC